MFITRNKNNIKRCKCCLAELIIAKDRGNNTNFCSWECQFFYRKMLREGKKNGIVKRAIILKRVPKDLIVQIDTALHLEDYNVKENDILLLKIAIFKEGTNEGFPTTQKAITEFEERMYNDYLESEKNDDKK
jgi:hypothetical protein